MNKNEAIAEIIQHLQSVFALWFLGFDVLFQPKGEKARST
ncbi:hypothetical protein Y59_36190 [Enterobacter hormaechei]|nr:hypothetical protein Y59_36190 [Enterobacter hormaechei]